LDICSAFNATDPERCACYQEKIGGKKVRALSYKKSCNKSATLLPHTIEAGAKAEAPANKRAKTVLRIMVVIIRRIIPLESDFFSRKGKQGAFEQTHTTKASRAAEVGSRAERFNQIAARFARSFGADGSVPVQLVPTIHWSVEYQLQGLVHNVCRTNGSGTTCTYIRTVKETTFWSSVLRPLLTFNFFPPTKQSQRHQVKAIRKKK
jgi:hypothetical protein